jgi:undecaprenyl-phosphate 4-deoxy-4-formamido-L-arabinose transferase
MDDDLQHNIDYIDEMIKKIDEGSNLVFGISSPKDKMNYKNLGAFLRDIFFKINFSSANYYKVSSLRLFRSSLIKDILKINYKFIYLSAILLRLTDKIDYVNINKRYRIHGKSNYNFIMLISLFFKLNYYYSKHISEKIKPKGNQYYIEEKINL